MSRKTTDSRFDIAYQREGCLFGDVPSEELVAFLAEQSISGRALDLGCGDGRDTVALLQSGLAVTAIDCSPYAIRKLLARPQLTPNMRGRLEAIVADIRTWQWPAKQFDVIVATTILDHIEREELPRIIGQITRAAKDNAAIFVEVHTVDDPALTGKGPVSEFASEIRHYFEWNELLDLLRPYTRVLLYREKIEADYDHGPLHYHGVAIFLGTLIARGAAR